MKKTQPEQFSKAESKRRFEAALRLARHYGYAGEARGSDRAAVRTWLAEDAAFHVDGGEPPQ